MKNKIKVTIAIILTILVIIFGVYTYIYLNVDYKTIIDESMTKYNISEDTKDLDPILKLIDKYRYDKGMTNKIQNYSYERIVEWYKFLDRKYNCTFENNSDCIMLNDELNKLNKKLETINNQKSKHNQTIIHIDSYNNLYNQGIEKEKNLENIINYIRYKEEYETEQNNQLKCLLAINCNNCINNYCSCEYLDVDKTETITCPKK